MDVAQRFANLSTAKKLQVGAIIVKDDRIISIGYNGMPPGWSNECETVTTNSYDYPGLTIMETKPEVIHAEANAIAKLARSPESGDGSTMFVTHAPCIHCAKQIFTAGVKVVYYHNTYRDGLGIQFLEKCNIPVFKV